MSECDIIGAVASKRETAATASDHWLTEVIALLRCGQNVMAIKHTRVATGWGLLRAKRFVEALIDEIFPDKARGEAP